MRQRLKRRLTLLGVCLLVFVFFFVIKSYAEESAQNGQETELAICFLPEDEVAVGVKFYLYRIADEVDSDTLVLNEVYSEYPITASIVSTDDMRLLATTLQGYIDADDIAPDYESETDANGIAAFRNIPEGFYLVTGEQYQTGETVYLAAPFILSFPYKDDNGQRIYQTVVESKHEKAEDEDTNLEILKIWTNDSRSYRPDQVEVELYADGELHDTVTLSKANNWRHHWDNLPDNVIWSVRENDVAAKYTVAVEQQKHCFVITNTGSGVSSGSSGGSGSDDDSDGSSGYSSNDSEPPSDLLGILPPDVPLSSADASSEILPQTGLFWWPVPMLIAFGLLLYLVGELLVRGMRHEKHDT